MKNHLTSIRDSLAWLTNLSVYPEINGQKIHTCSLSEIKNLSELNGLSLHNSQHLLHLLNHAFMQHYGQPHSIDLVELKATIKEPFWLKTEQEQIDLIISIVHEEEKSILNPELSDGNPYLICWYPREDKLQHEDSLARV